MIWLISESFLLWIKLLDMEKSAFFYKCGKMRIAESVRTKPTSIIKMILILSDFVKGAVGFIYIFLFC